MPSFTKTSNHISNKTTNWLVVMICSSIMLVEGFDMLIYSNSIPVLLADTNLHIDKAVAGSIGSMIFLGMLLGGIVAGKISNLIGLTKTVVLGFIGFTIFTALIALAQAGWHIGVLRFLAGIGLGVVLPAGLSLARKHSSKKHSALAISIVMSGIAVGGMLAALVAKVVIPISGWRPLFIIAGVFGFILIFFIAPLLAKIEKSDIESQLNNVNLVKKNWRTIFNRASCPILLLGVLATLADLLTWYGISTWLVQLLREFEVSFYSAMHLMFTLNLGAILGSLFTASIAIKLGARPVAIAAGLLAGCSLIIIGSAVQTISSWALFAIIAVLGMSAISAQNLVNSLVADAFPTQHRATAMGITLGIGRLGAVIAPAMGGYILAGDYGPSWVMYAFAIAAFFGVIVLLAFTESRNKKCYSSFG